MLTYDEKCQLIMDAKPGDVWVNRKTGKKVKILATHHRKLKCQQESGRITYKQHHYFAGDNDPVKSEETSFPKARFKRTVTVE